MLLLQHIIRALCADCSGTRLQLFGLAGTIGRSKQGGVVFERGRNLGMLGAQSIRRDRPRPNVKWLGLAITALVAIKRGKVVEALAEPRSRFKEFCR